MNWIEAQLKKMDGRVEKNKVAIITSIAYEDMIRNGSCTAVDFIKAQNVNNSDNELQGTRSKMKDVIEIAYDMVQNL